VSRPNPELSLHRSKRRRVDEAEPAAHDESDRDAPPNLTATSDLASDGVVAESHGVHEAASRPSSRQDVEDPAPRGRRYVKTGSRMKVESLPILDNLATQVLSTFAKSSYQDAVALVSEPGSDAGQEYFAIRNLFEVTRRVYTTETAFLSPTALELREPPQVDTLRKANLATFVSSLFGAQEIGFSELDAHFLEMFVPEHGRLLKAPGSIFLELKTQAFIALTRAPENNPEATLFNLFPGNLESRILARRPGARGLAPSETDFIKRTLSRREILLAEIRRGTLGGLPERYRWESFLKEVSMYISKNFEALTAASVSTPTTQGHFP
jgi:protein TBF1